MQIWRNLNCLEEYIFVLDKTRISSEYQKRVVYTTLYIGFALFMPFGFHVHKDWLSNLLTLTVLDEGYSRKTIYAVN
jgi:hypothetical protein